MNKISDVEIQELISSNNKELIYKWLLNEYCYGRMNNVKILFEAIKYYIVDLIRSDTTTQESFKLNLIESLNKIKDV